MMEHKNHNNRKRKLDNSDDSESEPPAKRVKIDNTINDSKSNDNLNVSAKEIMSNLSTIFNHIEKPCDLTVGGKTDLLPSVPGLYINEIGHIALPICDVQYKLLLSKTDETVCKSLEFISAQFYFKNPEWNKQIKKLINSIAIKLGCDDKYIHYVKGHCYKLSMYDKNTHFIQNNDTQKVDGMFASLVVQLPSNYEISENKSVLIIKHKHDIYEHYFGTKQKAMIKRYYEANSDEDMYDIHAIDIKKDDDDENKEEINKKCDDCEYNIFYGAYYYDLIQQRNKIKTGIRMVVTYNLYWNGPKNIMPKIANNIEGISNNIDNVLKLWNAEDQRAIAVNLEHIYTKNELSNKGINALKGSDFAKVDSLMETQLAKQGDLVVFIAEAEREIHEYDTWIYGHGGGEWEESERITRIKKEWYTENGMKIDFGKYIDVELETNCIGYNEDDEEWEEIDHIQEWEDGAIQITTYSKYIAIFFNRKYQFNIILNGIDGIKKGIEWIIYLIENDENYDITSELKAIINKFDAQKHVKYIILILSVFKEYGCSQLLIEFIHKLTRFGVGLHGFNKTDTMSSWYQRSGYKYYLYNDSKSMINMIIEIIDEFEWNESIKSVILSLIDGMQYCYIEQIKYYFKFWQLMIDKMMNKLMDNEWYEIGNRIWQNIIKRLQLNINGKPMNKNEFNAETIVDIFEFILSNNCWNKRLSIKQNMLDLFNKRYNKNVDENRKELVINHWIKYLENNNNKIGMQINELMNKYEPKCDIKQISSMLVLIMKINNIDLMKKFIDDNMISIGIGLHDSVSIMNKLVAVIIKFGWKEPIKSLIMRLLQMMESLNCDIKQISNYCLFPKLLKDKDKDIMNDKENICWKDIANKVWILLMNKMDLTGNNDKIYRMNQDTIICILKFMSFCEWNQKYGIKMFKLFENGYKNINKKMKKNIIFKLNKFTWNMLETGNVSSSILDKEFESFLKSNKNQFEKRGFKGIVRARKWAKIYSNPYGNINIYYSVKCIPNGRGSKSYVLCRKTSNYWNTKIDRKYNGNFQRFIDVISLL